ncbi:MAG: MFS transporter [Rubrobacteraceae bacterium]
MNVEDVVQEPDAPYMWFTRSRAERRCLARSSGDCRAAFRHNFKREGVSLSGEERWVMAEARVPEALREPVGRFGLLRMVMLGVVHAAVFMGAIGSAQILLPIVITDIDPANREINLGYVTGVAAFFGAVGGPIVGALSDRTTLRFGRRRPWMLAASVLSAGALAAMSWAAESIVALILLWSLVGFANAALLTAARAFIPDQVPEGQRGVASGIFSLGLPLGTLLGTVLVASVIEDTGTAFVVLAAVNVVSVVLFLIVFGDPPLPARARPPMRLGVFFRNFWINPREHPDFVYVWVTRVLVLLGWQMGTSYLLFFLEDAVGYEEMFPGRTASQGVASLTIIAIIAITALFLSSFVSGWISDKVGQRRPFVIGAGLLMGVSLLVLAFARDWPVLLAMAALLGLAIGMFIAVELALITQLLPSAEDRGKDIGLVNLADSLPYSLGPLMAGFIVAHAGYPQMFVLAAVVTTVGAILVTRIKGAR